jgi:hypothetical protein
MLSRILMSLVFISFISCASTPEPVKEAPKEEPKKEVVKVETKKECMDKCKAVKVKKDKKDCEVKCKDLK